MTSLPPATFSNVERGAGYPPQMNADDLPDTGVGWRLAIYASAVLWLAMVAGNIALYSVRPVGHWPALEAIEVLQAASLIPVALYLHRRDRSTASLAITVLGVAAMLVQMLIGVGFASGATTFGQDLVGGPLYIATFLLIFAWLFLANALAWRRGTLPRWLALLGVGTAASATLLLPFWAIGLARRAGSSVTPTGLR